MTHTEHTPLQQAVHAAFEPAGPLARATEQFHPRAVQTEMALAVARTIERGGALVVEAGTGVGKTFSYLVPALLSGERVLLSTATKTLQDQLFGRDLPRVAQALGLPVRMALLKGRASYLCLHRLDLARTEAPPAARGSLRVLAAIERWSKTTRSGDLADLPVLDERSPLIPLVTSTRENCLGSQCPKFRACHVNLARREALAADVVVVNHHLFFADLSVRESGMAELLPTVRVVVFDEAHQLNETGVQFLGRHLTSGQILDFARDLIAAGLQLARGLVDWQAVAGSVEHAARELRLLAGGKGGQNLKLRWTDVAPDGIVPFDWLGALAQVEHACAEAAKALDTLSEIAPDFVRLRERATGFAASAAHFAGAIEPGCVRWADVGAHLRLTETPLDIAQAVQARLLRPPQGSEPPDVDSAAGAAAEAAARRAWIFTSATLGDDPRLRWFTEPCGLTDAEVLRVGSPFDYATQSTLFVPHDWPKPNDPSHSAMVARLAGDAALVLGGSTMVLTTSLRALRGIGDALQARFQNSDAIEVLVQGQGPKRRLIERFREARLGGTGDAARGCVLVASVSFWEGVDVPGDALRLVVIDKLPFPPPNDPLVEARAKRLESDGRSPFNDYFVPEAAVALKQGAGRLIRSETDRGALVVCDTRLATMGYGRRLLAALPPMRRVNSEAELLAALAELTRSSTTDRHWA